MFKDTKALSSFSVDDVPKAKEFYGQTLGLNVEDDPVMGFLQIHLAGGGEIMVYPKGPEHSPASFTILNFQVEDIDEAVDELTGKGITFEQYDTDPIKTNEKGIARDENGPAIAWFKDPAGNVIALVSA